MTNIGPHLLGRLYVPDERDWNLDDLLNYEFGADVDRILNRSWLVKIWDWIVSLFHKPNPFPPAPPSPGAVLWDDKVVLDQGNYGTCVGNGWAGWGDSAPVSDSYNETAARAIYYEATCIDGSCDSTYQQGATVRSGAKAMQNRGRLAAYAFAQSLADVDTWLEVQGPVVFGSDWTSGMFNPDSAGFIRPTGGVEGGHCYLCIGYDPADGVYTFRNSWGTGWGLGGDFKMHATDVQWLLDRNGEACCALELP